MQETGDAERAVDLLLDLLWWVECTPEPQVELDTAVKWGEGVADEVAHWPRTSKDLWRARLDRMRDEARASDEFIEAMREIVDDEDG